MRYYYDTDGRRVRKDDATATEYYVNGSSGETEAVVKSDESGATHNILGLDNLGQVKRSGSNWAKYYYLKDHLGTIKMTVDGSAAVVGYDDYYPFGMQMDGRCGVGGADPRYKFTGKERDVESQYDYFGARYYDARVGRWLSVDPMGEKTPGWTLYRYGFDNPLRYFDDNGLTEKERKAAIDAIVKHVRNKTPYSQLDCSALVAVGIVSAGLPNPIDSKNVEGNGVARIALTSRAVGLDDLREGDAVTFRTSRQNHMGPDGIYDHIGLVSEIYRDKDGKVSGFAFMHASSGANEAREDKYTGDKPWRELKGAYQWDTPEREAQLATSESPIPGGQSSNAPTHWDRFKQWFADRWDAMMSR